MEGVPANYSGVEAGEEEMSEPEQELNALAPDFLILDKKLFQIVKIFYSSLKLLN